MNQNPHPPQQTHTAGPWTIIEMGSNTDLETSSGWQKCYDLCMANGLKNRLTGLFFKGLEAEEAAANARLIAASPTMYEYVAKRARSGDAEAQSMLDNIHAS